jgi:acylphosphatase
VVRQSLHAQAGWLCHILHIMRRVRVIVTGRVQGVGYRASTVERARAWRVTGWVRNLADGSVELEAQGGYPYLSALLAWCGEGPPAARVTGVTVEDREIVAGEHDFVQRR